MSHIRKYLSICCEKRKKGKKLLIPNDEGGI